jgi:hypothetical protein
MNVVDNPIPVNELIFRISLLEPLAPLVSASRPSMSDIGHLSRPGALAAMSRIFAWRSRDARCEGGGAGGPSGTDPRRAVSPGDRPGGACRSWSGIYGWAASGSTMLETMRIPPSGPRLQVSR